RIVAAPDDALGRGLKQSARHRGGVGKTGGLGDAVNAGELDPAAPIAIPQQSEQALKTLLRDAVLREEHPHVCQREIDLERFQPVEQLVGEPPGQKKIEVPAELGAARFEPRNARQQLRGEPRLGWVNGRDVDAHPAHAEFMQPGELCVRRVFFDVDDAARMRGLPHCIQHAAVVTPVGARLHEDEALEAQLPGEPPIVLERRERRRVAQLRVARGIALGGSEDVEMRVAAHYCKWLVDLSVCQAVAWTEDQTGRFHSRCKPSTMPWVGSCEQAMSSASQSSPIVLRASAATSSSGMRPSSSTSAARKLFSRFTPMPESASSAVSRSFTGSR